MTAAMHLATSNLLHLLEQPANSAILALFRSRNCERKRVVSTPYDQRNDIIVLKQGRLRVFLSCEEREFTLAILEPGDIFSTHTRAYVEALEPSEILTGSTTRMQEHLANNPAIAFVMVKVLGELLKNSISTIEGLAFKDTRSRLIDFLLGLPAGPESTGSGTVVQPGLTTEEIARLIGTTRQTVSALINELIRAGLLSRLDRKRLLILDREALRALIPAN